MKTPLPPPAKKAASQIRVKASRLIALICCSLLAFTAGIYAIKQQYLPALIIDDAINSSHLLFKSPWQLVSTKATTRTHQKQSLTHTELTKLVRFTSEKNLAVSIINNDGIVVHEWAIDWFSLWPNATHVSYFMQPKSRPGTIVHGAEILPNGDLVFNFEYLGMMRIDACGNPVWQLPYQTHHSIFIDEQGFIWAGANKVRKGKSISQGNHTPFYVEPFILKISPDGKVIEEKSVFDILSTSGLSAALYLSSINNESPIVHGDTLHLNDVEIFPSTLQEGFFKTGDIMISLRNINAIFVLDGKTWQVKHSIQNLTTRQHDPDFIDGNTISVYDNNNQNVLLSDNFSRIVKIHIPDNHISIIFSGSPQQAFYSAILGKQQYLDNGNWLITESRQGRVIEVSPEQNIVWEYNNIVEPQRNAIVTEAERLDRKMNIDFFINAKQHCQGKKR
jgi:hypothetical protein